MSKKYKITYLNALAGAIATSLLAIIILGPVLSFVLHAYTLSFKWDRLLWLAAITFLGRMSYTLLTQSEKAKKIILFINYLFSQKTTIDKLTPSPHLWLWLLAGLGFILPFFVNSYWLSIAILCLIYILLGLGLNIIVGLAGLLNLGYVAFYAIGAYSYALGAQYLHMGFWLAIPFGACMAGAFGVLLAFPVLRMYGDYLAIVTLGFGEIIHLVLNNWASLTGGPNGMEVPNLPYTSSIRAIILYLVVLVTVCITLRFVVRLQRMPLGRTFEALREDEIACRSLGINHVSTKLMALGLGAMIGGVGGVFFASLEGFVSPASFTFVESALILSIVVLGGMGSTLGVVLAAIVLTLLPELLRDFSEYRMLIYGVLLVVMMIWRPQGLIKFKRQSFAQKIK